MIMKKQLVHRQLLSALSLFLVMAHGARPETPFDSIRGALEKVWKAIGTTDGHQQTVAEALDTLATVEKEYNRLEKIAQTLPAAEKEREENRTAREQMKRAQAVLEEKIQTAEAHARTLQDKLDSTSRALAQIQAENATLRSQVAISQRQWT